MTNQVVVVSPDESALAAATAARLLTRLAEGQAVRGAASVVLTGGGVGIAVLAAVSESPARGSVDWREVDVWWGDERFVNADDPARNELQARKALLDHVDVDPVRVHAMGAADGPDPDPEVAAERYRAALGAAAPVDHLVPPFDVLLLGLGEEGHTASIFPESPASHDDRTAFAVHGCPKPPPTRITLGFAALNAAREVWMVAAGAAKAGAVAMALSGAGRVQVPAAGVAGRQQTLWLLDEAAAASLPRELRRR